MTYVGDLVEQSLEVDFGIPRFHLEDNLRSGLHKNGCQGGGGADADALATNEHTPRTVRVRASVPPMAIRLNEDMRK